MTDKSAKIDPFDDWISRADWLQGKDGEKRKAMMTALAGFVNAGGVQVSMSGHRPTRSKRANAYLWGVVYPFITRWLFDHHGKQISDEAIHEACKALFLDVTVEEVLGREVKVWKTTTKLTSAEFGEFLERVTHWAAEFGCVVPEPKEKM